MNGAHNKCVVTFLKKKKKKKLITNKEKPLRRLHHSFMIREVPQKEQLVVSSTRAAPHFGQLV